MLSSDGRAVSRRKLSIALRLRQQRGNISTMSSASPTLPQPPHRLVLALGVGQIFAWGTSFYLLSVIAKPLSDSLGTTTAMVFAGLTLAFISAGICAPAVGLLIERFGGRPVLAASSLLLALGLVVMGSVQSLTTYFIAWAILGAAMSAGLYDAAFSALGKLYGSEARPLISELTLYGGFASTICWPITAYMVAHYDWRAACYLYAAVHLLICMPLHLIALPKQQPLTKDSHALRSTASDAKFRWSDFLLVATVLTIAAALASVIAQHAVMLLQGVGYSIAAAVSLGMLIGPSQVASRIAERVLGRLYHPVWTLVASTLLVFAGLLLLWWGMSFAALALIFYGAGNGIYSIARGAVPLAVFGPDGYAPLMGRIAFPSLVAQALAPWGAAALTEARGAETLLGAIAVIGAANCLLAVWLAAKVLGRFQD